MENFKGRIIVVELMTEKEKMLAGKLYDANYDTALLSERARAKDLCFEYNNLRPSDEQGSRKSCVNCWARQALHLQ